ncbi:HNH endonuclease signature motif containing protein [Knoellia sp. CPCC 206453]|uniref:HNH endonuclease signature motif containing protein n=1 Tax=Knoellia pratensis TaxID=3404796 RepID=UPI00360BA6F9
MAGREALAQQLKAADSSLKVDQARADALAQLVLQQADITVHLHGTVPDDTTEPAGSEQDTTAATAPPPASANMSTAAAKHATPAAETKAASRLTEVGGLGSTQPTLLDVVRLAAARGVTVVPSTSLTCHPDTGAIIRGVVPASLARLVRKDAARRSDKYVVPTDMARLVRLRDGRCRFPNCLVPASKTDQDHVIAWPIGETIPINLMCLCRRHHGVKQRRGWKVRLDPDGIVHWTDPTGRVTTTYPINHLDRVTVPVGSATSESNEGSVARAFDDIVRTQLRDLGAIPTVFEDHLWRALETTHRGSTLGCMAPTARPGQAAVTWWHPADVLTLDLAATSQGPAREPISEDPPF